MINAENNISHTTQTVQPTLSQGTNQQFSRQTFRLDYLLIR